MKQGKQGIYARYIKRLLDILLSGCALIVLSPVLLVLALLVRSKLGGPVIFCQERPGRDEKIFKMYKFRSMTDERDADGELLPDEVRLTHFGRIAPLQPGAASPPRRPPWTHRTGPGQWPQRHLLGGEIPAGCGLCPAYHLCRGREDRVGHCGKGIAPRGHQRGKQRNHGGIPGNTGGRRTRITALITSGYIAW